MGFLRPVLWLPVFCVKGFLFVLRVCFVAFFGRGEYFLGFFMGFCGYFMAFTGPGTTSVAKGMT